MKSLCVRPAVRHFHKSCVWSSWRQAY